MIYKVTDRNRVVHYNVIGFVCLVTLCATRGPVRFNLSPVSWRRTVDCMACLVRFASLTWCGHGSGEAIHVDPEYDGQARRRCYRCSATLLACGTSRVGNGSPWVGYPTRRGAARFRCP